MLNYTVKYMIGGLHSKRLVQSAMILRPQYQRNTKLHPNYVEKLIRATQAPQPLAFKIHKQSENIVWDLPHPKALGVLQKLPFTIERTFSGNLPVYLEYKNQRNIKRTVIRKISGDIQKLATEVKKVVSNAEVRVKVGQIIVPGIHRQSINMLLLSLGF